MIIDASDAIFRCIFVARCHCYFPPMLMPAIIFDTLLQIFDVTSRQRLR